MTKSYIQLLQINDFITSPVYQCKLYIKRSVYNCGWRSYNSRVGLSEAEFILDISRESCYAAHATGILKIGNKVITGLKINHTITHPMIFAGSAQADGTCTTESYSDPYGSWPSVTVQGTVTITLKSHVARVDNDNDRIFLQSGTSCRLTEGTCMDSEDGQTFWNTLPYDTCRFNRYSILHEGPAIKTVDQAQEEPTVYTVDASEITFALAITHKENVCGFTIWRTEHPKLAILDAPRGQSFAKVADIAPLNLDIFTYINSKFVYVERHIRKQIKQLYSDVLKQKCELERETLKNSLAIATQTPDQFAYNLMKGPGYMAVIAGEVVHVIKCVPVEVMVKQEQNCYAELQVSHHNRTFFLTPKTRVLKSKGTLVTCNRLLPAYYQLGNEWYKILPALTEAKDPITIEPSTKATWKYVSPASLATSGIYTERDLNQLRDHIMFPVERYSILNEVAREMQGHTISDSEGTLSKLLNEDAMERIIDSTWGKIWSRFITFGTVSAGVIALLMILQGVKLITNILINGYLLHQAYGWSIHLLGAVWSSLAYCLIHLKEQPTEEYNKDNGIELLPQSDPEAPKITFEFAPTAGGSKTTSNPVPVPKETTVATLPENSKNKGFFKL